jgi:microcystin-dependent protein
MGKLLNTTRVIDRDGKLYPRDVRDLFDRIDILLQERQQAGSISNNAFGAAWNGVTDIGASKDAIYDKITAMDLVSADKVAGVTGTLPIVIGGTATNPNVTAPTVAIAPATNTDNNVPQWNGADSKTLKNGRAIGIADTNLVQVDDAAAANGEYARFTASGVEGVTLAALAALIAPLVLTTGTIKMWTTAVAPSGYLMCDGSAVNRITYADLFALIGTTFGVGNGTTTFNLPDFTEAAPVGVGTRGAGVTAHDAFALAEFKDDQLQGFGIQIRNSSSPGGVVSAQGSDAVSTTLLPKDDGTNGTPRTGTVTRGKRYGIYFIIKY